MTNKLQNQRLSKYFNTLKDYYNYLLHIQRPKWLLQFFIIYIKKK